MSRLQPVRLFIICVLATWGGLVPASPASAQVIVQTLLGASDGKPYDAFGSAVSLTGTTLAIGAPYRNAYTGAVYIFTQSKGQWIQQAILTASDARQFDEFGATLLLSGKTLLVGAVNQSAGKGAVYVFTQSAGHWAQQQKLAASDGQAYDLFGTSVAASGNVCFIGAVGRNGAAGAVYQFTLIGSKWSQKAEITAAEELSGDYFGASLTLAKSALAIGAPYTNNFTGAAYVFAPNTRGKWTEQALFVASDGIEGDEFGSAVALSGSLLAVGSPNGNALDGLVYLYSFSNGQWSFQNELIAYWGVGSQGLVADGQSGDAFGSSLVWNGNALFVGAPFADNNSGAVYIDVWNGSAWVPRTKVYPFPSQNGDAFGTAIAAVGGSIFVGLPGSSSPGTVSNCSPVGTEVLPGTGTNSAFFGDSVTLSGSRFAAAMPGGDLQRGWGWGAGGPTFLYSDSHGAWRPQQTLNNLGSVVAASGNTLAVAYTGAVSIFEMSKGTWNLQQTLSVSFSYNNYPTSIALSGNTLAVGAADVVSVFTQTKGIWTQQASLTLPNTGYFGTSLALEGNTLVIGDLYEGNNGVGGVWVYTFTDGKWVQAAALVPSDGQSGDLFGNSVAVSGSTIVVGAPWKPLYQTQRGAVYVFTQVGGSWAQQAEIADPGIIPGDVGIWFGLSVSVSGNLLAVGTLADAGGAGSVYAYALQNGQWILQSYLTAFDGWPGRAFGRSVSLSGSTLVIGAPSAPNNGIPYNPLLNLGAAYVLTFP